jgi:hypothetical protein
MQVPDSSAAVFFWGGGGEGVAVGWGKYMFMCVCGRGLLGYSVVDPPLPPQKKDTRHSWLYNFVICTIAATALTEF